MNNNKILFAGPLGVGVSSTIKTISDIKPETHKENICNENGKEATVELDYGVLEQEKGNHISLYGIPNKEVIKPIRESLSENCIGLVLLINNLETEPVNTLLQYIDNYQDMVGKDAIAVGITRYDKFQIPSIDDFHVALRERNQKIPVFSIDAHKKNDVIFLIKALLYNLDSGVK